MSELDKNTADVLSAIQTSLLAIVERDHHYEKERAEHIGDIRQMNTAINALTESNKEVNKNITKLLLQTNSSEQQITTLYELVKSKDNENKQQMTRVIERVDELERQNLLQTGERRATDRQSKFWHDNWFKIVTLFIISIPVIAALYHIVKK